MNYELLAVTPWATFDNSNGQPEPGFVRNLDAFKGLRVPAILLPVHLWTAINLIARWLNSNIGGPLHRPSNISYLLRESTRKNTERNYFSYFESILPRNAYSPLRDFRSVKSTIPGLLE